MEQEQSIFSRQQYDRLKETQRLLHDMLPEFDKAEKCGVVCSELRGIAEHLTERLSAIEQYYMTPPPR